MLLWVVLRLTAHWLARYKTNSWIPAAVSSSRLLAGHLRLVIWLKVPMAHSSRTYGASGSDTETCGLTWRDLAGLPGAISERYGDLRAYLARSRFGQEQNVACYSLLRSTAHVANAKRSMQQFALLNDCHIEQASVSLAASCCLSVLLGGQVFSLPRCREPAGCMGVMRQSRSCFTGCFDGYRGSFP